MNLKDILGDDLYAQVSEKINAVNEKQEDKNKQVHFVDLSEGNYVSKGRYNDKVNELTSQVNDLQGQITQRDTDMTDLQTKLTAAQTDATKLTDAQTALTELQGKYESDKKDWESKISQQAYEYKVKERANSLKFSSNSAKNEFVRAAIAKQFQSEGDELLGFNDYVNAYKESDPGAFTPDTPAPVPELTPESTPDIVIPGTSGNQPTPDTKGFGFHFNGVRAMPDSNK